MNVEAIPVFRNGFHLFHRPNVCHPWPDMKGSRKVIQLCRYSLCEYFQTSLAQVARPATEAKFLGFLLNEIAKPHALNPAGNDPSFRLTLRRGTLHT